MKHLFTFRQRPNESLTDRVLSGSTAGVERTVKRVSNECRMTLDRPSTYTLSHSSVHQQAATLPNNAACGNNKRLCRSTIPSFKKVASLLLLFALSFGFTQQAWADCQVTTYTSVWLRGLDGVWDKDADQWKLTNDDNNHYWGKLYVAANKTYYFRVSLAGNGWSAQKKGNNTYTYTSSATGNDYKDCFYDDTYNSHQINVKSATSGYVRLDVDWWGSYDWGSCLKIVQNDVASLSISSLNASANTVTSGKSITMQPTSVSGGSGSYTYSYNSSAGGSFNGNTFTAPLVYKPTTTTITVTVSDANSQLSGLTKPTKTKTITINPPTTMYLKHAKWSDDGNDWGWKSVTHNGQDASGNWLYTGDYVYYGSGCNYNTTVDDGTSTWVSNPTKVGNPADGDLCTFTLNPSKGEDASAITITKAFTVPNDVRVDGPLNNGHSGEDDGWGSCGTTQKSTVGNVTTFTYTKTRDAGNYLFCFKTGDCKDLLHYPDVTIGTTTNCTLVDAGGDWHNFKITTTSNGQITITVVYDTDHKTITVNATGPTPTHTITPVAKFTTDGSTYTTGTTGGTVKINGNTSAQSVTEGSTYTINATAASGYVIEQVKVGSDVAYQYAKGDATITEWSNSSYKSTTDLSVTVKFAKVQDIQIWVQKNGHNGFVLQENTPQIGSVTLDGIGSSWTDHGNWISIDFGTVTKVTTVGVAYAGGVVCQKYTMTQTEYWSDATGTWTAYDDICDLVSVSLSNCTTTVSTGIILTPTYATAPSGTTTYAWSVTSSPDGSNYSFSSDNTATTTFTADKTGNYTVQISMTSGGCATKTATATITVNKAPATPTITSASVVKSPVRTDEYFQVQFSYAGIPSGACYRIKVGDGYYNPDWTTLSGAAGTVTFTSTNYAPTGTNTVTVEIWNSVHNAILVSESAGTLKVVQMRTIDIQVPEGEISRGTVSPSSVQAADGVESANFTATPNDGYEFDYWETSAATITVANDHSATTKITSATTGGWVRAHFRAQSYAITKQDDGHGSISCVASATVGTQVTITATPNSGYEFDYITVNDVSRGAGVKTFTMPAAAVTVKGYFKPLPAVSDPQVSTSSIPFTGAPVDVTLTATSTYLSDPIVVFEVNDGTTTFEIVGTTGAIGDSPNYSTTHTATFSVTKAGTFTVAAKLYAGYLVDNFETNSKTSWEDNNGSTEYVANPAMQAKNGGKNVQKIIRNGANWQTALTRTPAGKTGYQYAHIRQYRENTTDASWLKISDTDGCFSNRAKCSSEAFAANTWQDIVYNIEGCAVDFIYPMVAEGASMTSFYIDDIILSKEQNMPLRASGANTATITSTAISLSLATSPAPIVVGETSVTITPTLTAPAGQYTICYKLMNETGTAPIDPQPTFAIDANGVATFTPATSGNYKIKATVHAGENACDDDPILTATTDITVRGKHKLTVAKGTGVASVGGGRNDAVEGQEYTITATTSAGYTFHNWQVSGTGASVKGYTTTDNVTTATVIMGTDDATFTASATAQLFAVTMPSSVTGKYDVTYTGEPSVAVGSMVNFTVTPATGYDVTVKMNGTPLSGTDNAYSFIMPATDATVTVVASLHNYTINFVVNPAVGGSIIQPATTPKTDAHYNVPFVIEALENTGYHFVNWTSTDDITLGVEYLMNAKAPARKLANNVELQTSSSQRVSNAVLVAVGGDKTITANFAAKVYTVTLDANGGTAGTTTQVTATYNADMPTIEQAALPTWGGHEFLGYFDATIGGTQYYTSTGASARTWNKTDANVTLYAHWQEVHYYIEGRFGVRSTAYGEIDKFVNSSNHGEWKTDSKNIELLYNETAHAYQLNTYCSVKELSQKIGDGGQYFHIAEVKGNSETFTQYTVQTNYEFKNGQQSTTLRLKQKDDQNIVFNDAEDNSKPVILTYDPTTKTLSYTATALMFTVNFGLCDGQSATEGTIGATVNSVAIATGSKQNENTVITITAAPQAGYTIQGWYSDAACTKVIADFGTTSSHDVTLKTDTSVYVKFTPLTVYFINTDKWDNVYAYNYTGENKHSGAWPGAAMTKESTVTIQGRTFDVYKYNNVVDGSKIIFNNGESEDGKKQTDNLTVTGNYGKYFMADECFAAGTEPSVKPDGTWYNSLAEAQAHGLDCTTDVLVVFDEVNAYGTITATKQIDDDEPEGITSGALVDKGAKLVFQATPNTTLYEVEGFYWDEGCAADKRYTNAMGRTLTLENVENDTYVYVRFDAFYTVNIGVADNQDEMGITKPTNIITKVSSTSIGIATAESKDPTLYSFDHWSLKIDDVEKADWTGKDDKAYGITLPNAGQDSCTIYSTTIKLYASIADAMLVANFRTREVVTVYFVNSNNWSDVHVHLWGGSIPGTTFPGIYPTKENRQVNGHDVYSYTFDKGTYTQVLWNCGSNACKTNDIIIDEDKPVYNQIDGILYPSLDAVLPDPIVNEHWTVCFNANDYGMNLVSYDGGNIYSCTVHDIKEHVQTYDNWLKMKHDNSGDLIGFLGHSDNDPITEFPTVLNVGNKDTRGEQVTIVAPAGSNITFTFNETANTLTVDYAKPTAIMTVSATEWDVDSKEPLVLRAYAKDATNDCQYRFFYKENGGSTWHSLGDASATNVMEVTADKLKTVPASLGTYQFKVEINTTFNDNPLMIYTTKNVDLYKYYWVAIDDNPSGDGHWANHLYCWGPNDAKNADYPGESITETDNIKIRGGWVYYRLKYPTYDHWLVNNGNESSSAKTPDLDFDKCYMITGGQYWDDTKKVNYWPTSTTDCPSHIFIDNPVNTYWMSVEGALTIAPTVTYYGTGTLTYTWSTSATNLVLSADDQPNVTIMATAVAPEAATLTLTVTDGIDVANYDFHINTQNGIVIRVWRCYNDWTPVIRIWNGQHGAEHHNMNYEGNGWYSYPVASDWKGLDFMVMKNDESVTKNVECTMNVTGVTASGCWKVSTDQWKTADVDHDKHMIYPAEDCGLYFRVHETMADGKTTYHSNKVTKVGQDLSFYAANNGKLTLQHFDEAANKYVDIQTLTNPEESYVQVAKFAGDGISNMEKYTGDYWLRTNAKDNWNTYLIDSHLFTEFTRNKKWPNEKFNYYFVEHFAANTLVTGQVANRINDNLATFIKNDKFTTSEGNLPSDGNVRFGYCPETNFFERDIIADATGATHFLEIYGDNSTYLTGGIANSSLYSDKDVSEAHTLWREGDNNHSLVMTDMSNWIYQADVYALVDNQRTADTKAVIAGLYNGTWKYLLGYDYEHERPSYAYPVLGATSTKNIVYHISMIYDFKTNRLTSAWTPTDMTVEESLEIDADVMFLRHENEDVAQVGIAPTPQDGQPITVNNLSGVVFCLEIANEDSQDGKTKINCERHYLISLPFDCNVRDIYGLEGFYDGTNDGTWGIQRYNGERRAREGYWAESANHWEWLTKNDVMKAGEGYAVSIVKQDLNWKWIQDVSILRIFFPSISERLQMSRAEGEDAIKTTYANQPCTITRDNRNLKDGNWKIIGAAGYNNSYASTYTDDAQHDPETMPAPNFRFRFEDAPNMADQHYIPEAGCGEQEGSPVIYRAFYGYPVQFAGTITWLPFTTDDQKVQGIAPRRYAMENEVTNATLRLELQKNGKMIDQTFVQFNDAASTSYDLNLDLGKMAYNPLNTTIYTMDDNNVEYAGNSMPSGEYVIPVGANIKTAGTYTFAMPAGTEQMTVYLLDYETGDKIDLGLSNYTVTFSKKANLKDRFALQIDNRKLPTDTKVMDANGNELIKFIRNEQMYILRDGHLYNANGAELNR